MNKTDKRLSLNRLKSLFTAAFVIFIAAVFSFSDFYGFQTASAESEQDINAINDVGLLYYNSGNYEEAISEFKKILKKKPDHDVAYFNIGCVYQKKKDWKEAERSFSAVLELIPDDGEAQKRLVSVCEAWINQLTNELSAQPDNASLHNDLGRAYLSLGKLEEAYQEISKAISLKANLAAAYYNFAELYVKKQSPEKALPEIKKACEIEPKNIVYSQYYKKVAALAGSEAAEPEAEGETSESGTDSGVFTGSKKDEENIFKAGVDAYQKKKYEQALSSFEKVYRLNPKNAEAGDYINKIKEALKNKKNIRDLFESADKKCKKDRWSEAIPLLEKAKDNPMFKDDSNYMDVLRTLSDAYMRTAEYAKAQTIYEDLKAQNPNLFFINYNLAQIYLYNGEYDKGEESLTEALKADGITAEQIKLAREILSTLSWKRKRIYLYILGFLVGAAMIGVLYVFNSPAARKTRFLQRCEEFRAASDWNGLLKYTSVVPDYKFSVQENVKINLLLATACYNMEKFDDGIKNARKALNFDSSLSAAHDIMARCFLKKKSINDEAIFQYKKLLKSDPGNAEVLKLISEYYIKLSKNTDKFVKRESLTDELIDNLKLYAVKERQNRELAIFMANLLRQRKDTSDAAVQIYENALSQEENTRVREVLAKAYYDNKNYEKAINECKLVFKENVENTQMHRIFIDSYMALGRYGEVCLEYEKLTLLYPNSQDLERRVNELKRQNMVIGGSPSQAAQTAVSTAANSAQSQNADTQGAFKTGASEMTQAPQIVTTDYARCFERGLRYIEDKDYTNAISEFKVVIKGAPHLRNESYKFLVTCYLRKGLLDLAYEQYKLVRYDQEMMPEDVKELTYNLARAFEEKGKFKESLEVYNIICKVDIGYKDVFDKFEELHAYISKFN
ncbi:MAG: tetratricopeptide repeat protein [bacterium ADurb.Bin243]|nr:MAG: tetratricopeptide repeat protein [bacterium ADurb.Bin243]